MQEFESKKEAAQIKLLVTDLATCLLLKEVLNLGFQQASSK